MTAAELKELRGADRIWGSTTAFWTAGSRATPHPVHPATVVPFPADRQQLTAVLEFRDVRKHFRSGEETIRAIDGLSLSVPSGEMIALFGPSGSGKSTLLRIAAAIEPPDSGAVLVDGERHHEASARARPRPIACAPSDGSGSRPT